RGFSKNVADRIQNAGSITIGPRGLELKGLAQVAPLPPDVQERKVKLNRFTRALGNKELLDSIADALGVARSTDVRAEKANIILEIDRRVETNLDMDALSKSLQALTGQHF